MSKSYRRFSSLALSIAALTIALHPARTADATGRPWRVHALIGARVVVDPDRVLPSATVVIRDGIIEAVGTELRPPADARVWNLSGKTLYAGLIDAYVPASKLTDKSDDDKKPSSSDGPADTPKVPGDSHDLPWVHPDLRVARTLAPTDKALRGWRASGFVAAHVVPDDGIFRGSSAVVSLGSRPINESLLRDEVAQVLAFEGASGAYPSSTMGIVAQMRQTLLDARWYRDAHLAFDRRPHGRQRPPFNRAFAALEGVLDGKTRVVFDIGHNALGSLRSGRIAAELGLDWWLLGSGSEYLRLDDIANLSVPIIVPLDFPPAPSVDDDDNEWTLISTDSLRHWQRAPHNPGWLAGAGITIALTAHRLDGPKEMLGKVRAAIDAGLDDSRALAALTTTPARLLGVDGYLGSIERGKAASLVVTDGDLFAKSTRIEAVWIDGLYNSVAERDEAPDTDISGVYHVELLSAGGPTRSVVLDIERTKGVLGGVLVVPGNADPKKLECVAVDGSRVSIGVDGDALGATGSALLRATSFHDGTSLVGELSAAGQRWSVLAEREGGHASTKQRSMTPPRPVGGALLEPAAVVVRNATIWTQGPDGRIEDADLVVRNGRVDAVGRSLDAPPGAHEIDGRGKHVTPGIIDAHSHTAIDGAVNEGTRAVTAEVRIGDVVDSEDWNLYSELAGGLTTAQLLHGSANPIGGQSQTIKLRWGRPPEGLKFEGAKPGIKFALGENVKQSNWGDAYDKRYPQTRLGVEQAIRERFVAARDYSRRWDEYRRDVRTDPAALPPRTDLQLETIAEILRGERLIHCHSYRQDEILTLVRLMDEFDVTIGTFQHVLEGYKVADELAAHGAGASTFSDWWAYKFEVLDAIPYNGALMWDRGVVVSFNSDSNELARRLAVEATKAVKYGGLTETEALKLVTINPARQLRIDHRVGSLERGKDGDFVLWNGDPLSTLSVVEETWIEGRKYFDRTADIERRATLEIDRQRLIDKARKEAKPEKGTGSSGGDR